MDIEKQISQNHSKENTILVSKYIGDNPERFEELLNIFMSDDYRQVQRASWIVNTVAESHPGMVTKYLPQIVAQLHEPKHDAVKRNVLRLLQFLEIPENLKEDLINICFDILLSAKEPIAIKVFGMTVLEKATRGIPELQNELALIIEDQYPYGSAGFKSRANKILKKIKKQ